MTEKQLHDMLKLLNEVKDDCHCLSVKDLDSLRMTCEAELHAQSVKSFRDYVSESMPAADCSEADWHEFNETEWTIMFGRKAVTIVNTAPIYSGILDTLNEYIDECLD